MGFGNTPDIHPCPDIPDICTGIGLIHNGQFHAGDAFGQFCYPGIGFPQQISRQSYIFPDLGRPDPANLFHRFLIVHIVLAIIHRCNIQSGIRLGFVALLIGLRQFCPQRDQGCYPLRMVTGNLHIGQVLPKLHRLQRAVWEILQIIQKFSRIGITHLQVAAVGLDQLILYRIQRHGIIGIAVTDVIVIIGNRHRAKGEPLLFFHGSVMHGKELLQ